MIEQTVYSIINTTTITSVVGTSIYPTDPNENTSFPFIVYKVAGRQPVLSMSGATNTTQYTIEINIWATSVIQQQQLQAALIALLNGYSGAGVLMCYLNDSDNEELASEQEGDIYHCTQTYIIWATV